MRHLTTRLVVLLMLTLMTIAAVQDDVRLAVERGGRVRQAGDGGVPGLQVGEALMEVPVAVLAREEWSRWRER